MKLLSKGISNKKIAKSEKQGEYLNSILHLSPALTGGFQTCPKSTNGCRESCLFTSGYAGIFPKVNEARIRKTKLYFENRNEFYRLLISDIESLVRKGKRENKKVVIRLNGTSDLQFENDKIFNLKYNSFGDKNIFELFPDVQFYDYTKIFKRLEKVLPVNYYLTFSRSENNLEECIKALKLGFNVAVVFSGKVLPLSFTIFNIDHLETYPVLSGENNDLRFLEGKQGAIIGLIAKGKARKDNTGFVIDI